MSKFLKSKKSIKGGENIKESINEVLNEVEVTFKNKPKGGNNKMSNKKTKTTKTKTNKGGNNKMSNKKNTGTERPNSVKTMAKDLGTDAKQVRVHLRKVMTKPAHGWKFTDAEYKDAKAKVEKSMKDDSNKPKTEKKTSKKNSKKSAKTKGTKSKKSSKKSSKKKD